MKKSIGRKIGAVLALGLAALGVVGALSDWATCRLIADSAWVTHAVEVDREIASFLAALHEAETQQRGYLLTGAARYQGAYKEAAIEVSARLTDLHRLINDPDQKRRLVTLEPLINSRLERLAEGESIRTERGLESAVEYASEGTGLDLMNQIRTLADEMIEGENALLAARRKQSEASTDVALGTIRWGIPIAVAAVFSIGLFLTRHITGPLKAATAIAERLAVGDVSVQITGDGRRDEVGQLLQAFRRTAAYQHEMSGVAEQIAAGDLRVQVSPQSDKDGLGVAFAAMATNLRRLTGDIAEAVTVLNSASTEIVASTAQLSAAATETAGAVTETTTTVEQVRLTAQVSSQKAQSVSESAQKAALSSQAGRKSTEETVQVMERIRQQMESIAGSMERLSEQTQAIGNIISTVDDLAAQSNLLAVNAAIEAAKAGEQGKGFAVVAQEVRSLADQSKQATNQVRTILRDIQKATSAAVMATEQGSKAVESGVQQSTLAGDAILALAGSVSEAAQAATQIVASNQQQLIGVVQVASAMESIRQSSSHNVASARQLETSARNLSDLGQKLEQLTQRYRVLGGTGDPHEQ